MPIGRQSSHICVMSFLGLDDFYHRRPRFPFLWSHFPPLIGSHLRFPEDSKCLLVTSLDADGCPRYCTSTFKKFLRSPCRSCP